METPKTLHFVMDGDRFHSYVTRWSRDNTPPLSSSSDYFHDELCDISWGNVAFDKAIPFIVA